MNHSNFVFNGWEALKNDSSIPRIITLLNDGQNRQMGVIDKKVHHQ